MSATPHPFLALPTFGDSLRRTSPLLLGLAAVVGVAMWFLPPLLVAVALAGLVALGLLVRWPVLGVYALILSVPVQKLVTVSGLTITQILIGMVGVVWLIHVLMTRTRLAVPPIAWALGVYMAAQGASLLVAHSLSDGFTEMYRWLILLLAYLLAVHLVQTRLEVVLLVGAFVLAAAGEAVLGVVQSVLGIGPASFQVGDGTRSFGTFGMPNSFAGYLNLTLPLALALATWALMHARAIRRTARPEGQPPARFGVETNRLLASRPVLLALALLLAAGMIATGVITSFSRGAWLGLAFGVVVMIAALGRRGRPAIVGLGALVALLLLLASAGALPSAVVGRLGSIVQQFQVFDVRGVVPTADTFAQIERLAHWQTAGNMFLANPVLGVGIGNFNARFPDYYVRGWPHSQGHAHNYYLQTLAETGLVGFATYVLLLLTALGSGLAALRRTRGLYQALTVGALGVLATFMLHNVLENLHVLNLGLHWAAVLALFTILPRAQAAEDAAAPATPGRPAALRGAA